MMSSKTAAAEANGSNCHIFMLSENKPNSSFFYSFARGFALIFTILAPCPVVQQATWDVIIVVIFSKVLEGWGDCARYSVANSMNSNILSYKKSFHTNLSFLNSKISKKTLRIQVNDMGCGLVARGGGLK